MRIGISYNLKSDFSHVAAVMPDDRFEELDDIGTVEDIEKVLHRLGHETVRLGFGMVAISRLRESPVDLVFNICEGVNGRSREAQMPAIFDMLGVPWVGSDALTIALALDKAWTKKIVQQAGFATPPFYTVDNSIQLERMLESRDLHYPLFVKLSYEGSSMSIDNRSRVRNVQELRDRVQFLLSTYESETVLVEEFMPGREFTVGILGNREPEIVAIMEVAPSDASKDMASFVYGIDEKRNCDKKITYRIPENLDEATEHAIRALAIGVYKELRCRDMARVDVRLDENGVPNFIEVNTLPGLNKKHSDLPIMARLAGMSYDDLIARIAEHALERLQQAPLTTTLVTEEPQSTAVKQE
jgi:D-alanine-D-alanine ligase